MTSAKLVAVWVLGALFLLGGMWIMNNLEQTLGVSEFSYMFAILIALVAFLLTGLCWISVAAAHH
ncbi:MAG: hypothetical protein HY512_02815 [Candidatus Aenigmarchaeota archaeon]|nr:hypothetical protein [Candidatus Aenigmarchaeota archaeon]